MPNLDQITTIINLTLQAGSFSTQRFQGGDWNDIAEFVKESGAGEGQSEIRRPVVVSDDGDCKDVSVNDTFPLVVYHRVTGLVYEEPEDFDFGNPGFAKRETASMRMVFFGDRSRLQVTQENILAAIAAEIPEVLTQSQLTALQLITCQIEVGDGIIDKYEVFAEEYQGIEYGLKPNSILIAVPYKIVTEYRPECFSVCN